MITSSMLRFGAHGCGALLLYFGLLIALVLAALGIFGLAVVRSDWFGVLVFVWTIGAPVVGLLALRVAKYHSSEKGED
jgi:hypothetical protein